MRSKVFEILSSSSSSPIKSSGFEREIVVVGEKKVPRGPFLLVALSFVLLLCKVFFSKRREKFVARDLVRFVFRLEKKIIIGNLLMKRDSNTKGPSSSPPLDGGFFEHSIEKQRWYYRETTTTTTARRVVCAPSRCSKAHTFVRCLGLFFYPIK